MPQAADTQRDLPLPMSVDTQTSNFAGCRTAHEPPLCAAVWSSSVRLTAMQIRAWTRHLPFQAKAQLSFLGHARIPNWLRRGLLATGSVYLLGSQRHPWLYTHQYLRLRLYLLSP
jgi:hypothetical protein